MQKNCNGQNRNVRANNDTERQGDQGCDKGETGEDLGFPNSTVWSGNLNVEKS